MRRFIMVTNYQIPQSEIEFGELMAFLLDRGAMPDIKDFPAYVAAFWTVVFLTDRSHLCC